MNRSIKRVTGFDVTGISALAVAVFFVFVPNVFAQDAEEEAAHNALRELRAIYEKAVNERRIELLEPHLDKEFSGVMITDAVVNNPQDLRAYWQYILGLIGENGTYSTRLEPDLSWIHGDIAVAKGSTVDEVTTGSGDTYHFGSHWTAVLVHREDGWKLRRIQATMDPIENVFVQASRRGTAMIAAAGGVLVGLLLGFAIGTLWARRKAAPARQTGSRWR